MVNHFNKRNRRDLGIVWLVVGLIFLFSGFSGGFIFLVMGALWLASSNERGASLFSAQPDHMRTLLTGATVVLLLLALVILLANAIP